MAKPGAFTDLGTACTICPSCKNRSVNASGCCDICGMDAFADGVDAFHAGRSDTANPYDPSTDAHLSWNDGWNQEADLAQD